jgi:hypothetical protein
MEIIVKLSSETIEILRHFARIQRHLTVEAGNVLRTRTEGFYAEATVPEIFPIECGIPDVRDFLRTIAWFKEPVLEFAPEHVYITEADGTAETLYACVKPDTLGGLSMTRRDISWECESINCSISGDQWSSLHRALGAGIVRKVGDCPMPFMNILATGGPFVLARKDIPNSP